MSNQIKDIVFDKNIQIVIRDTFGQYNVGDVINISGGNRMIVVHKGRPNSPLYDDTCDGVWLMREEPLIKRQWHNNWSGVDSYEESWLHNYLNTTYFNMWSTHIQSIMKEAHLPQLVADSVRGSWAEAESSPFTAKMFILSMTEIGVHSNTTYDGIELDYFKNGGTMPKGWTRTQYNTEKAWCSNNSTGGVSESLDVYPCMIVPYDATLKEETEYITNTYVMTEKKYLQEQYKNIVECERDIGPELNTIYPALDRTPYGVESNYGITEMVLSGYVKWTEDGVENSAYFNQDITRQCQGLDTAQGTSSTFTVCGVVSATNPMKPRMFSIKLTAQANSTIPSEWGGYTQVDLGIAVNEAVVSDGQKIFNATPHLLKLRTILPQYLESI